MLPQVRNIAAWAVMSAQDVLENRKESCELYGYDLVLDSSFRVWLLEVCATCALPQLLVYNPLRPTTTVTLPPPTPYQNYALLQLLRPTTTVTLPLPTPYSNCCFTTPCTLHIMPYTLHPTPYTLRPTPYTLHPTPYTTHHSACASSRSVHPTPPTLLPPPSISTFSPNP